MALLDGRLQFTVDVGAYVAGKKSLGMETALEHKTLEGKS